ncbi:flavodoxin family protein [Pedobacter sp.]|uniref:flavodoxin family protein n=1 Tax=Pedobacter sp. TaxID=1411316 RepID=UPI003C56D4EE
MNKPDFSELKAVYINCTLKKSPAQSHTAGLMEVSRRIMEAEGVKTKLLRLVDYEIAPGVQPDMTKEDQSIKKDDWPEIYKKVIEADILVIGTPIWLGERSSVATQLVERLYAMSAKQNEKGQYVYYGKVGGCVITGNEDGIKHCAMGLLYAMQHIGYSIPPQADCGWIGAVGPGPSYGDTEWKGEKISPPVGFDTEFTNRNTTFMTYNLMHLAIMLKTQGGYPAYGNSRKAWDEGSRWDFESPEYR